MAHEMLGLLIVISVALWLMFMLVVGFVLLERRKDRHGTRAARNLPAVRPPRPRLVTPAQRYARRAAESLPPLVRGAGERVLGGPDAAAGVRRAPDLAAIDRALDAPSCVVSGSDYGVTVKLVARRD